MHAVMGIVYGSMLAYLLPDLILRWNARTSLARLDAPISPILRWSMSVMAVGVFASGVRDLCASFDVPGSAWPWRPSRGNG
jgi:hypothetical protein